MKYDSSLRGCQGDDDMVQPDVRDGTTPTNTLVGGVAPKVVREPGRKLGSGLHQPLITEMLSKRVRPQQAGCITGESQREGMDMTRCVTLGEDTENTVRMGLGDGEDREDVCGDIQLDDLAHGHRGMKDDSQTNMNIVKDVDKLMVAPSVDQFVDQCVFRRGVCQQHRMKGERYVQETKNWKDRGKGKGFGFVTSRKVRYRCMVMKNTVPRSSSSQPNVEVEGALTCGE